MNSCHFAFIAQTWCWGQRGNLFSDDRVRVAQLKNERFSFSLDANKILNPEIRLDDVNAVMIGALHDK